MVSSEKLTSYNGDPIEDGKLYRSIVGGLQYVTVTRPEIVFSMNRANQFMHNPLNVHFKAIKSIFRYLKGTTDCGVHLTKSHNLSLTGFCDSDWAND